ncbi:MAG: hypothetical protein EHM93_08330 [Bacteroidales bacterium]|nr:MAG: hypothetical protein EHM93_08330 [Bacteroidales bacterium]
MKDKGFIFDYSKCVGCHACIVGCYNENRTNPPIAWRQVNALNDKKIPLAGFLNLSIACNHCIEAPCLKACPAKAYSRDGITGAVIHQPEKCIGCKYCTWACPYDAPKYNPQKGIVEKCHLCNHLIIKGHKPACANQCPTGALSFGFIDNTNQPQPFGIPKTKYQPRIKTLHSNIMNSIPEMDLSVSGYSQKHLATNKSNDKINAFEEWPLIIFTFLFSFLSGWIVSFKQESPLVQKVLFISLGFIGILLSAFHLGKPFRAPRSITNLKTSWLSREILFSGLFISSSIFYFFIINSILFLLITSLLGLLLLLSVEMVYSIPEKKYVTPLHSSNTIITALMFGLYFSGLFKLLVGVIVLKAILYLVRKKDIDNHLSPMQAICLTIRFLVGLMLPLSVILLSNPIKLEFIIYCLLIGELIDRYEFYDDLYINSPSRMLDQTLKNKLNCITE